MAATNVVPLPGGIPLVEIGETGLPRSGGVVADEFLRDLQGARAVRIYKEMSENDPVVGAMLFAVEMLIRQLNWRIIPFSDKPRDIKTAAFVEECRNDMLDTWQVTISEMMSFLTYGWSFHEIVYKKREGPKASIEDNSLYADGKFGWKKMPGRAQSSIERWLIDGHGVVHGVVQNTIHVMTPQVTIPMQRGVLLRSSVKKGNPQGRSVLRNCYRPWFYKKRMEEIEGIGVERGLAGLPVAFVPPNIMSKDATEGEKALRANIEQLVRNIRRDEREGIVFPAAYDANGNKLYDLQLLSTGTRANFDTSTIISRYDTRIAVTILADFLLIGHERVGSFALSADKSHLFAKAIEAWADEIGDAFNRDAIPRLFLANGMPIDRLPKLEHDEIANVNLKDFGDFIERMVGAGASLFPDEALEGKIRNIANLPPKAPEAKPREIAKPASAPKPKAKDPDDA